jgi:predicted RNase H-related nuclease YkuK (DUF458 family)
MSKRIDLDAVRKFISESSDSTKIYIGCDSEKRRNQGKWIAEYITVVIVHKDGCKGAKIFYDSTSEIDYDKTKSRPATRLMNEVIKAAQMYLDLEDSFGDRKVEIHLDINPDKKHGSSCVVEQAVGYIKGMCNVTPLIKPVAFASQHAADHIVRGKLVKVA